LVLFFKKGQEKIIRNYKMKKTAFIAIVGRPNVGKSTLLNAILGEKVAIVSSKPQTTRNRITGIFTKDDNQFVFLDTPGMHRPKNSLGEFMVKAADSTMKEADAVVLVVDTGKEITSVEENVINYQYKGGDLSILYQYCISPFCNWAVELLPTSLA
jgi:GTP-binding protein Era